LPPASAAKAPVADMMATKQIKPCLDMFQPQQQKGFAAHRLSPDLPVLQQVEQNPRAEQAEEEGGTTKNIGAMESVPTTGRG